MKTEKIPLTDDNILLCPKCERPLKKMGLNTWGCMTLGHGIWLIEEENKASMDAESK